MELYLLSFLDFKRLTKHRGNETSVNVRRGFEVKYDVKVCVKAVR